MSWARETNFLRATSDGGNDAVYCSLLQLISCLLPEQQSAALSQASVHNQSLVDGRSMNIVLKSLQNKLINSTFSATLAC